MTLGPAEQEVIAVVVGCVVAPAACVLLARRGPGLRHPPRPALLAALAAIAVFVGYTAIALRKLSGFNMGAEDLGRIDQAIWSVLQGQPLVFSAWEYGRPMSRMAGHVELLYLPLSLLFRLWDSAGVLIVAQAGIVAAGAWPAWRLGARVSPGLGLASTLGYLLHPAVGFATLADVHGDTLAMPLLLLALERGLAGRPLGSFLALALAIIAKEYIAVLAVALGLYWWIGRQEHRLGLACMVLGTLWLAVVVPAVHARYRPAEFPAMTRTYYGDLGQTPSEVLATGLRHPLRVLDQVVTPRKVGTIALLLAPLGFAALARPGLLLVALTVLLPLAVSHHLDLRNHHNATLIPFLLVASVGGAHRLAGRGAPVFLVAATLVAHITIGPSPFSIRSWTPGRWDYLGNPHMAGRTAHDDVLDQAIALVRPEDRVTASGHIAPHLSHREVCYAFPAPIEPGDIDVAVVDLLDGYAPAFRPRSVEIAELRRLLEHPDFGVELARDGVFVLSRRSAGGPGVPVAPPRVLARPEPPQATDRYSVWPLTVERAADGSTLWHLPRELPGPLLILDSETRAIRRAASVPTVQTPGGTLIDPEPFPAGRRTEVLVLHEGFPAIDPTRPPQPWLPDPRLGSRLLPPVGP